MEKSSSIDNIIGKPWVILKPEIFLCKVVQTRLNFRNIYLYVRNIHKKLFGDRINSPTDHQSALNVGIKNSVRVIIFCIFVGKSAVQKIHSAGSGSVLSKKTCWLPFVCAIINIKFFIYSVAYN